MKLNNSRIVYGCSILILLVLLNSLELGCLALGYYWLDLKARTDLSTKLGIEPNWDSFSKYIPEHIKPGMTRIEVLQEAEKIGPYQIDPFIIEVKYCEAFYFYVGPLRSSRGGRWDVCYNQNFIVTSVEKYWWQ